MCILALAVVLLRRFLRSMPMPMLSIPIGSVAVAIVGVAVSMGIVVSLVVRLCLVPLLPIVAMVVIVDIIYSIDQACVYVCTTTCVQFWIQQFLVLSLHTRTEHIEFDFEV